MDRYGDLDSMLPLKGAAVVACEAVPPDVASFDVNDLDHDMFWALGPIFFYNASVTIGAPRVFEVNADGSAGFGLSLTGNRPVWCVLKHGQENREGTCRHFLPSFPSFFLSLSLFSFFFHALFCL